MSSKYKEENWESAYWAKRREQLNNSQQSQASRHTTENNGDNTWEKIDVDQALQQRAYQQAAGNITNSGLQQQNNSNVVSLRDGHEYYTAIQGASGFGATVPMVRSLGKLPSNIQGRQFLIKGEISAYCIDNLPTVDLSKINEYPERKITLIRIAENMFTREILVSERALVKLSIDNKGRNILKG